MSASGGPSANYLIKFLKTQDKGFFATSLFQYVKEKVAYSADQVPLAAPLKDVGDQGGEFFFRLK